MRDMQTQNHINELKRFDGQDKNGKCLNCKAQMSFCGLPYSAEISCPKCGAVNVFEESFQPVRLREVKAA